MSNDNENKTPEAGEEEKTEKDNGKNKFLCMYIAIGCFAAGCVLFALSFLIKGAGVYLLISSMIAELASVSFLNGQKRRVETSACKLIRILSYVVMAAGLLVFIIGMSVSGANNG